MPASKCPTCGYRNSLSAPACANCGTELHVSEALLPALPSLATPPRARQMPVLSERPRAMSRVIVSQSQEDDSPYQTTLPDQVQDLVPFESIPPRFSTNADWETLARLPFGFALLRPRLVGSIIHIEAREQVNDFPNLAGALLALLAEIIWVIPNVQATREQVDRIEVTRLRIQREDGQIHDAIVRGSLRGANLSMGDLVSLWGHRRKGNLVVRKGYDHTTRSAISTTSSGMLIPALLILAVVAFLYLSFAHMSLGDAFQRLGEIPAWLKSQALPFLK